MSPAVRSRVIYFHSVKTCILNYIGVFAREPAEDVELAIRCCGGVSPSNLAHACQLHPCVGLRVVHED
eukprot:scaffold383_cov60-Phaeocystis_antarctica.AAC.2